MFELSVLIPTFNRSKELIENVNTIVGTIGMYDLSDKVEIVISDNGSSKEHRELIEIAFNESSVVRLFCQEENLGFEKNCVFLMKKAFGKFVMLLGDDDYISSDYFLHVIELIESGKYVCIIPNCYAVDTDKNAINHCRDKICDDKILHKLYDINYVVKAHQMSGLTFKKEDVIEAYTAAKIVSVYPQIFFLGFNLLRGDGVHVTRFPIKNTVIKQKNYDYSFDNLFGEVAVSIDALKMDLKSKFRLELYVVRYNAERFCNRNTLTHPIKFTMKVISEYSVGIMFKSLILCSFFFAYPKRLFALCNK